MPPRQVIDISGTLQFGDMPLSFRVAVPVTVILTIIGFVLNYFYG